MTATVTYFGYFAKHDESDGEFGSYTPSVGQNYDVDESDGEY